MNYRRKSSTHKKRPRHNKKKYTHKKRHFKGGRMTTSVDTNPISYRDNEYKEMNELAKGGANTPESQGPMTLDELNISGISSSNNTNDGILTEYQENNISGFAQDQDEGWEDELNGIMQGLHPNHDEDAQFWDNTLASDEEAQTEMETQPSFGSMSSIPTTIYTASTITDDTIGSDMSMGGKKKRRTNKRRYSNKKRRTSNNKRHSNKKRK
uniref:Uncharacterized protein n=1 Tax=viral metagenome TaxID=1070528 RepID=A0A6C0IRE9_9ZZZZ